MSAHRPFAWLRSWSLPTAIALLGATAQPAQAAPTFESLTADHVLVNVPGGDISLSNAGSSLYGTFLDVPHGINLTPGTVYGAVMGNDEIHTSSGSMVFGSTYAAPVAAIPKPQTYALMLGALGAVGWVARRRRAS